MPTFDPHQPFEPVMPQKPAFDPKAPFDHSMPPDSSGPSKTESFLRGGSQGATLNFGDELSGALEAVAGADQSFLTGKNNFGDEGHFKGLRNIFDNYARARDTHREQNDQAEAANPNTYLGGSIAGGFLPAIASGALPGAGAAANAAKLPIGDALYQAAQTGARYGAATGLGGSRADLTRGDVGGALRDTAASSVMGAATGGLMEGALRAPGAIYDKAAPMAVKAFSKLRGLSPETVSLYANPETRSMIDSIATSSDNLHDGQYANAERVAKSIEGARSKFIDARTKNINTILDAEQAAHRPVSLENLMNTLEGEKSSLLPVGSANKKAISGLDSLKEDLLSLSAANQAKAPEGVMPGISRYIQGGEQEAPRVNEFVQNAMKESGDKTRYFDPATIAQADQDITRVSGYGHGTQAPSTVNYQMGADLKPTTEMDVKPFVTPVQLNKLRQTFNDEAKAAYTGAVGQRLPGAQSVAELGNMARTELDNISPQIRAENAQISNLYDAEAGLKNAGLTYDDIDPKKLMNLLTAGPKTAATQKPYVNSLDELLGTNLGQERQIARATSELNPEGAFHKIATGYSLFPLAAGALSIPVIGPGIGSAIGLTGAALQAPILTKPLIRAGSAINTAVEKLRTDPGALGKFGSQIMQASQKGPQELAVSHFVLSETDPEYREKMKEFEGGQ